MNFASLQEIRKWESEAHTSTESANKLSSEKVERMVGVYIAEKPSEKNVVVMALKFDEIEDEELVMDEQIATGKSREVIREEKYKILGYYQGDVETIKEKIREFFKDSKTPGAFRINQATFKNKKIIEEIEDFVKSENNKIECLVGKITFKTCDLQTQANDQKKYTDSRSEAYRGLRKLREENKIAFDGREAQNLKKEVIHQLGTVSYPKQPDGRIKVEIAEDLSYEFLDALVFVIWIWGLVFGFITP